MNAITTCLWFNDDGEAAANYYCEVFPDSRILQISRYGEGSPFPSGTALTVEFELRGHRFTALNGGPDHAGFTETISFQIDCADQKEVDYYWDTLSADGGTEGRCGWVRDKFGLWWQVVPSMMPQLLAGGDPAGAQRAMQAMMGMQKLIIADLQNAYDG